MRKNGIKDNGIKNTGIKDNGIKDSRIKDSRIKDNEIEENEIEKNEIRGNEIKGNEIRRNEIRRNEIRANEVKRNGTKETNIKENSIEEKEEINYYSKNAGSRLQIKLAFHCAPVLAGIKASNTLVLPEEEFRLLQEYLQESGLSFRNLYQDGENYLLLLYRRETMEALLKQEENRQYLREAGYLDLDPVHILSCLSQRIKLYRESGGKNSGIGFPHEMGILLGYPIRDVEGFIENGGKNERLSGYWKVYQEEERAKKLFQLYDEVKKEAMKLVLSGGPAAGFSGIKRGLGGRNKYLKKL